jgi:hypothetical protein
MIENVVVAGSVMMKGAAGVLIPLGIELFVDGAATAFLYNLLSVSVILFIAAMSGPRSEAAFCIVIPIFAGIFESFGWLTVTDSVTHLPSPSATSGLIVLTIIMGIFGVFIYMNEQNKQNYGTAGPGSKLFNIAFFLMCFTAALTAVSGFTIFPGGATQPISGTCAVGLPCDSFNNIDFTSAISSIGNSGGLLATVITELTALASASLAMIRLIINIMIGVVAFPLVLNSTLNGIFPGISANAAYAAFLVFIELGIVLIYAQGFFELLWKPSPGTTI